MQSYKISPYAESGPKRRAGEYTPTLSENGRAGGRTDIFLTFAENSVGFMNRGEGIYHILAMTAVAIWGTTFVSTKLLLAEGMTPAEIMFYRFLIAYLVLKLYRPTLRLPESWRDEALFAAAGVTGGSLYFLTENMALQITLASNVALLLATAPILTVLLPRLLLGPSERVGRPLAAGSSLALAGVALVVFNGSFILRIQPAGDLLTLAAALTWALYNICLKKLDGRYSTLEITRKVFFYGVVTLLPVFAFTPLRLDVALFRNPVVAGNLLFLGLVASLFCFAVWNMAVKHLGTVKTSNYIYLVPLVALISSAIVLNERITPVALGGAVLILGGVYIAENGRRIRGLKPIHR